MDFIRRLFAFRQAREDGPADKPNSAPPLQRETPDDAIHARNQARRARMSDATDDLKAAVRASKPPTKAPTYALSEEKLSSMRKHFKASSYIDQVRMLTQLENSPEARQLLVEAMDYSNIDVGQAAVVKAALMGSEMAPLIRRTILRGAPLTARVLMTEALCLLATVEDLPELARFTRDSTDLDIRTSAAVAIGRLKDEEGVPILEALLTSKSEYTSDQRAAIEGLGMIGGAAAKQILLASIPSVNYMLLGDLRRVLRECFNVEISEADLQKGRN